MYFTAPFFLVEIFKDYLSWLRLRPGPNTFGKRTSWSHVTHFYSFVFTLHSISNPATHTRSDGSFSNKLWVVVFLFSGTCVDIEIM